MPQNLFINRIIECKFACKKQKPPVNNSFTSGFDNYQCPEQDSNLHSRKATGP